MGRKTVLLDDLDGKELPDDTKPIVLSLGRTTYNLFLSETNHGKLLEALSPFIENAETTEVRTSTRTAAKTTDKERLKAIREWAQANNVKYTGTDGEERTLGDRGRIPEEIIKAYEEAH